MLKQKLETHLAQLFKEDTQINFTNEENLTSDNIVRIEEFLKSNSSIDSLYIAYCKFEDDKAIKALSGLVANTNLTSLKLINSKVNAEQVELLSNGLANNKTLKTLNLSNNDIRNEGAENIAIFLKNSNITELNLSHNYISNDGAKSIAESLKDSKITILSIQNNAHPSEGRQQDNNINNEGAIAIAEALKNSNIVKLDLSYNGIGSEGAEAIAKALKGRKITELDLSNNNNIGDKGVETIAEALKDSNITSLSLSSCGIQTNGAKAIAELVKNTEFETLNLQGSNKPSDEGVGAIAKALENNKTLRLLSLDISSGAQLSSIAKMLNGTSRLELNIYMRSLSKLSSEVTEEFKEAIMNRSYHITINIYNNKNFKKEIKNTLAVKNEEIQDIIENISNFDALTPLKRENLRDTIPKRLGILNDYYNHYMQYCKDSKFVIGYRKVMEAFGFSSIKLTDGNEEHYAKSLTEKFSNKSIILIAGAVITGSLALVSGGLAIAAMTTSFGKTLINKFGENIFTKNYSKITGISAVLLAATSGILAWKARESHTNKQEKNIDNSKDKVTESNL